MTEYLVSLWSSLLATIDDVLPIGFRYQQGSARWSDPSIAEPVVQEDGRTLEAQVPILEPGETIELEYVVEAAAPSAGKALSMYATFPR